MDTVLYGIKNCDTVKRALKWMDAHKIDYRFHNYKKDGVDTQVLETAIEQHGWEIVINMRGTTWRNLPSAIQNNMDAQKAIAIAKENPSIIKRPLLLRLGQIHVGFNPKEYTEIF